METPPLPADAITTITTIVIFIKLGVYYTQYRYPSVDNKEDLPTWTLSRLARIVR